MTPNEELKNMYATGSRIKTENYDTGAKCENCGAYVFIPYQMIGAIVECIDCTIKKLEAIKVEDRNELTQGLLTSLTIQKKAGY